MTVLENMEKSKSLHELTYRSGYNLIAGKMTSGKRVSGVTTYFVYVEGESDQRLFVNFLDPEIFTVKPVANGKDPQGGGKKAVQRTVSDINRNRRNSCLGIVDRDYDEYAPDFSGYNENILVTDKRDSECMMLSTAAFNRMYTEWVDGQKLGYSRTEREEVRNKLIKVTRPVGLLRLLNSSLKWGMSFKELPWEEYVDVNQWELKIDGLIRFLVNTPSASGEKAPRQRGIREVQVREKYEETLRFYGDFDPWLICRGHDVVEVFRLFFAKGKPRFSTPLEGILRAAYSQEAFEQTLLAAAVEKWKNDYTNTI